MSRPTSELRAAFEQDGFTVTEHFEHDGHRGLVAQSKTAMNAGTNEPKRAYYVEGDPYTLGWLMGRMAEPQVANMADNYVVNVIPGLIDQKITDGSKVRWLVQFFVDLLEGWDLGMKKDIPDPLLQEIHGLVAGCKAANPHSKVDFRSLFTLNFGFDFLLSYLYAPNEIFESAGVDPADLRILLACNSFSAWGDATRDGVHYFGRDFMFPSADVFQYCAAMTVVVPDSGQSFVTMGAPGFVGSITAMNSTGLAAGVQMVPGGNVDHTRPGFNSLGLVRWAMQQATSAKEAVQTMQEAQRGVSWLYPISDPVNACAVTVEAGKSGKLDPLSYPSRHMRPLLPSREALQADPIEIVDGMAARWNTYRFPQRKFLAYNPKLFAKHKKPYFHGIFRTHGTPGDNVDGPEFPQSYLFSPQLTQRPPFQVTCNTYISPKMRLCSMDPWTVLVGDGQWDDLQWRYQALTWLLRNHFGELDHALARNLIDYLSPASAFYPNYYTWLWKDPTDWQNQRIDGCVSLLDLTHKTITSHWGNYGDDWVSLTLPNYL